MYSKSIKTYFYKNIQLKKEREREREKKNEERKKRIIIKRVTEKKKPRAEYPSKIKASKLI